jgi:hypothetical protein
MVLRAAGLIVMGCLALAAGLGCPQIQVPFLAEEEDPSVYPERVQDVLRDVERLVGRNRLRQAIELVESTRVDYPD